MVVLNIPLLVAIQEVPYYVSYNIENKSNTFKFQHYVNHGVAQSLNGFLETFEEKYDMKQGHDFSITHQNK